VQWPRIEKKRLLLKACSGFFIDESGLWMALQLRGSPS